MPKDIRKFNDHALDQKTPEEKNVEEFFMSDQKTPEEKNFEEFFTSQFPKLFVVRSKIIEENQNFLSSKTENVELQLRHYALSEINEWFSKNSRPKMEREERKEEKERKEKWFGFFSRTEKQPEKKEPTSENKPSASKK